MKVGSIKIPHAWLLFGPFFCNAIGLTLNALAMVVNHGQMPVLPLAGHYLGSPDDILHVCMTSATHLKFICDWIVMHSGDEITIMSPGDVFEILGSYVGAFFLTAWVALRFEKTK